MPYVSLHDTADVYHSKFYTLSAFSGVYYSSSSLRYCRVCLADGTRSLPLLVFAVCHPVSVVLPPSPRFCVSWSRSSDDRIDGFLQSMYVIAYMCLLVWMETTLG